MLNGSRRRNWQSSKPRKTRKPPKITKKATRKAVVNTTTKLDFLTISTPSYSASMLNNPNQLRTENQGKTESKENPDNPKSTDNPDNTNNQENPDNINNQDNPDNTNNQGNTNNQDNQEKTNNTNPENKDNPENTRNTKTKKAVNVEETREPQDLNKRSCSILTISPPSDPNGFK